MPFTAAIVTPWVPLAEDSSDQPSNHPQISDDIAFALGETIEDVTGQDVSQITPSPNEYTVLCSNLSSTTMDAIEANSTYEILWSEEVSEGV